MTLSSSGTSCRDKTPTACQATPAAGTSLLGWLVQTAFVAVVEGTYETFRHPRGFTQGKSRQYLAVSAFPSIFGQNALISRMLGRKCKLSGAGRVAGQRRLRRVTRGWF